MFLFLTSQTQPPPFTKLQHIPGCRVLSHLQPHLTCLSSPFGGQVTLCSSGLLSWEGEKARVGEADNHQCLSMDPEAAQRLQLLILSRMFVSVGLCSWLGVWARLSGDAAGHLLQKEPLWPHGSSAAREEAEKAVPKDKPVSAGTEHFFRGCNMEKINNWPQGDSSDKLQIPAKRESGDRDSPLKDFASFLSFNPNLGYK